MAIISAERKRLLRRIDFELLLATLAIIIYSLVVISSATHVNTPGEERYWFVQRQGIFALVNLGIAILFLNFDYRGLQQYGTKLYIFNLIMLAAVMFFGHAALICLASILEERVGQLNSFQDLLPILAYVGVPFLLVLKQPDLGTSLVFGAIFVGMIIVCGIRWKILFGMFIAGIAAMPFVWQILKDYQKMRIMVFLDPNVDPLGSGYHIIQSKIAIGSGMLFGKGLFEGTQSQLNFLPENHTDFIFAVVGEELGFVGAVVLLLLYLILFLRGLQIAKTASDIFGRLLAVGITSMLAFHVLVNVGMTTGIMPVTGIPLPLMSYGVSALTTDILSIAILMNIHMRKQKLLLFS